jgi:transposase
MLIVETIAKIRRAYFVQKKPIKVICREFRVSRKVVRKVIRSEATEFRYERGSQPLPKIGPWRAPLDELLLANEGKAARERLTMIGVYEELRGLGYAGSYDAVRRYAKTWLAERGAATAPAYVPLSFAPGEAYQFDWSHEVVLINGTTVTVKVAHVRLCHSRMLFVRAYPRETQEMVFDAHDRAFAFFKGACTRGIYDNMKTAVETVFVGKERAYNRRFLQMCGHYRSWSSSSAIRLRPHRSGQAAFPHPALPGSYPHRAARGVQGCVIRGCGKGKHAVRASNQSQPIRRFFWLRRRRQLNQMRRTSCRNPFSERQLCGMPK